MPAENTDPKRAYPYPSSTGKISVGATDFSELAKKAGEENRGEADFLQGGVISATDFEFAAAIETAGTGTIKSVANTGGTAWVPDATIGLMRTVTASGSAVVHGLKPASLPASGKYMCVGVELAGSTWNTAATVSVLSGSEKSTQAEAEAASPGVSANKIRVRDCILYNNGGATYELKAQFDRRPWATGGTTAETVAEGKIGAKAVTDAAIVSGRALVETGNAYGALTARADKTEYEPSAVRLAFVTVDAEVTETSVIAIMVVIVGGVTIATPGLASAPSGFNGERVAFSFIVPPKVKWKVELTHLSSLRSSYLLL